MSIRQWPLSELGPPNGHYLIKFYQEESLCTSLKNFVNNLLNNVDVLECVVYPKKLWVEGITLE